MRGLRTIPVLLDVCRDLEELCPDALLLNYVNPMAMLCWAVGRGEPDPHRRALPLRAAHGGRAGRATSGCRPASSTTSSPASTTWRSSCASSTTARTSTPRCASVDAAGRATACATRCCKHFGYFVTESSEHFAEYVPWFIKDGRAGPDRALQHPAGRVPAPLRAPDRRVGGAARGSSGEGSSTERSRTSTARDIIRACETGEPFTFNGNVPNRWEDGLLIDNLPARLLRRGAVRGLGAAASSRSRSARCRANSRR